MKIAINGFGRIGRMTLRALQNKPNIEVVAINDLTDIDTLVYLLKYDTAHSRFPGEVSVNSLIRFPLTTRLSPLTLTSPGKRIKLLSERDPEKLPWGELGIERVIESTGRFTDKKAAEAHIHAGAKKVLITAPARYSL